MADRFWVGGTGSMSDTNHWSTTSGGSGGASVPSASDVIIFDNVGFSANNQNVTQDINISCRGIYFDETLSYTVTYTNSSSTLEITDGDFVLHDMVTFNSNVTFINSGSTDYNIYFASATGLKNLNFAGVNSSMGWGLNSDGATVSIDNLTINGGWVYCNSYTKFNISGSVTTNNLNNTSSYFYISDSITCNNFLIGDYTDCYQDVDGSGVITINGGSFRSGKDTIEDEMNSYKRVKFLGSSVTVLDFMNVDYLQVEDGTGIYLPDQINYFENLVEMTGGFIVASGTNATIVSDGGFIVRGCTITGITYYNYWDMDPEYRPDYSKFMARRNSINGGNNTNITFSEDPILRDTILTKAYADDMYATYTTINNLSNGMTFYGTVYLEEVIERANIVATALPSTYNVELRNGAVYYCTAAATANMTLNFRGDAGWTLNNTLAVGKSITCTVMITNGATPYYPNAFKIDNVTVTPKWNGTAPTSGNANAIDVYTFTIIKTASTPTYTVLASRTKFA